MSIKSDRWIRKMATEHEMINPFSEKQIRTGVISYGLSSYGYDLRVADEFKIFTNVNSTIVDPKALRRALLRQHANRRRASSRLTRSRWRARSSTSKFRATC